MAANGRRPIISASLIKTQYVSFVTQYIKGEQKDTKLGHSGHNEALRGCLQYNNINQFRNATLPGKEIQRTSSQSYSSYSI